MTTIRISPTASLDLPALREAARVLDATSAVDRIVLGDDHVSGQSAVVLAAWLAPHLHRVALVPEVPVTNTEPFHAATTTATLDHLTAWSGPARAGWAPTVQTGTAGRIDADLVGLRPAPTEEAAWRHTVAVDEAVSAVWTSWDADAEIRDETTSRFIDRDRLHYTQTSGTDTAGETFTVKGPSIVPRSPQGELPTYVSANSVAALDAASLIADVVAVPPELVADAVPVRQSHGSELTVLLSVPASRILADGVGDIPDAVDGIAITVDDLADVSDLIGAL